MRPSELVTVGVCWYMRRRMDIDLPPEAVRAAFRLFGVRTLAARTTLLFRTVGSPQPAMRRLRSRAIRAILDYEALLVAAPRLRPIMRLDFCLLLGLYAEVTGIDRKRALQAGLVDAYCHLAALVDAYDDLLDRPEARTQAFAESDFRRGDLLVLRGRLERVLTEHAHQSAAARTLVDELTAFERNALAAHRRLDQETGLDAPLDVVLQAREATSGALLRLAARIWNGLLDLSPHDAQVVEDAACVFGVVAQFADDIIDWSTDLGSAQNLLDAALQRYPEERRAALRALEGRAGWSLPVSRLRRLAPHSFALLDRTRDECIARYPRDKRLAPLVRFGDDVYDALLPALPAIDFSAFDSVRHQVQVSLAGLSQCPAVLNMSPHQPVSAFVHLESSDEVSAPVTNRASGGGV